MNKIKISFCILAIIAIILIVYGIIINLNPPCVTSGQSMICTGNGMTYILAGIIIGLIAAIGKLILKKKKVGVVNG